MSLRRFLSPISCLLVAGVITPVAVGQKSTIDFSRDIRPILADKCFKCHGPDENQREADLRLDTYSGATIDLGGRSAVKPGEPGKSELLARIASNDDDLNMPPDGDRLAPVEIEKLRAWIAEGAQYKKHWAYVRPKRPRLPQVRHQKWPGNAIDYFVLARLEKAGLRPSPPADPAILLRRLYLDLIGLRGAIC